MVSEAHSISIDNCRLLLRPHRCYSSKGFRPISTTKMSTSMTTEYYQFGPHKIDPKQVFYSTNLSYATVNLRPVHLGLYFYIPLRASVLVYVSKYHLPWPGFGSNGGPFKHLRIGHEAHNLKKIVEFDNLTQLSVLFCCLYILYMCLSVQGGEVKRLNDLSADETSDLWLTAKKVGGQLESFYMATSSHIYHPSKIVPRWAAAGQSVPHVHVHIIPRKESDFEKNDEIYDAQYFGYANFRAYQKEVIDQILDKRDCLAVMATGSGKSLCYQVPPLLLEKDCHSHKPPYFFDARSEMKCAHLIRVMSLKQRGIRAEFLGSAQTDGSVHTKAQTGHFHLLFMTPEKACSTPLSFWLKLLEAGICLFAVDEAHCISEWGHDFRVEYKQLNKLRGVLLEVPFVALTATATEKSTAHFLTDSEADATKIHKYNYIHRGRKLRPESYSRSNEPVKAREESHRSFVRDELLVHRLLTNCLWHGH
ncbi:hypothetical protein NC652_032073 [Populus alba x Populus x berolinensis]|nr:hypothetical protein NC652_032073 [Populus alba x Populus x berolinensis]